jgi:hypothetical protein
LGSEEDDIAMPGYFYDEYNVPAELLFKELMGAKNTSQGDRMLFDNKLLHLVAGKKEYDEAYLLSKPTRKKVPKKFNVYFEVYFNNERSAPELFKEQIVLSGANFKWCSRRTFSRVISHFESGPNLAGDKPNILNGRGFSGLYKKRRNEKFPHLRDDTVLRPVKASVTALHEVDAVSMVATAFEGYMDCVNVAQSLDARSFNMSNGPTKSKSAIVFTGVFLAKGDTDRIDILWVDTNRYYLPKQKLTLTSSPGRVKILNNLLRAYRDNNSQAANRVRWVVSEFAQAIDTDNSNLRQLGFWRCLEIATRKTSENRKDKEIIKIFQNYYPDKEHWQQLGKLIHSTRNDYVHQGVASKSGKPNNFYLNWSQEYAEAALRILLYLYNNRTVWKTDDDIDSFFDNYSRSDRELELAKKFLIERTKSNSKK